jgi:hypothetical protein
MMLAWSLTVVAFVLILVEVQGISSTISYNPHTIIGTQNHLLQPSHKLRNNHILQPSHHYRYNHLLQPPIIIGITIFYNPHTIIGTTMSSILHYKGKPISYNLRTFISSTVSCNLHHHRPSISYNHTIMSRIVSINPYTVS